MQTVHAIGFLVIGAVLLLGSGYGILGLVGPLRRVVSRLEAIPIALLLSSGVCGLWAAAGRLAGIRIGPWSIVFLVLSVGLAVAGWIARRRARGRDALRPSRMSQPFFAIVLGIAALSFVLVSKEGGSLGPVHDSLDFVAFVNETLQTGELAPDSPIYKGDPGLPSDPRRGSFHTQVTAICWLSGASPADGWRWLPRLLVPLTILGLAAMLRAWLGARVAWVGTLLFFATTFFTLDRFIQNIGYASRFGWVIGWAGLLALARGLEERLLGRRREGLALLAVAAVAPAILVFVHLLSGAQTALALGCGAVAVWVDRNATREQRRDTLITLAVAGVLLLATLAFRLGTGKGVANPLFDHLYGVMMVAPGWPVLLPGYLMERFSWAGVAGAFLGLLLLPLARRDRAAGFLAFSTAIPLLILFFPPIVRIMIDAHAHSMLFRVILTIPFAATLAYCALAGIARLRGSGGTQERDGKRLLSKAIGVATLAVIALGLAGQFASIRSSWAIPERRRAEYSENQALVRALEFIESAYPNVQTVLSDPLSSYSIPAYTKHDAVAPYNQHSSPTDPSVDDRIRDVQEALNGRVGMARTFEVIRRYHVNLILLNQSFARFTSSYYSFVTPIAYEEQLAKFDRAPEYFRKIYVGGGIRVYAVRDPGPDAALPGDPPNPDRIPDPGTPPILASGPVELIGFDIVREPTRPGEPFSINVTWRRTGEPYELPVVCEVKVQNQAQPRAYDRAILGRIEAYADERKSGKVWRFGRTFHPLQTFYPDFLWEPGEAYKDVFWIRVPPNTRPGVHDVYIRLDREPYAPVMRLDEQWSTHLDATWKRWGRSRSSPEANRTPISWRRLPGADFPLTPDQQERPRVQLDVDVGEIGVVVVLDELETDVLLRRLELQHDRDMVIEPGDLRRDAARIQLLSLAMDMPLEPDLELELLREPVERFHLRGSRRVPVGVALEDDGARLEEHVLRHVLERARESFDREGVVEECVDHAVALHLKVDAQAVLEVSRHGEVVEDLLVELAEAIGRALRADVHDLPVLQ